MRKKTVEEYIEIIHALEVREGRAATGKIAAEMGVKPSSATEMVKKLQKEGLLQEAGPGTEQQTYGYCRFPGDHRCGPACG
jgi:Mn-dependent DtxR family transcriptional regulator